MAPAALGFRDHSGWAVMVGVAGDPRAPEVVLRERVELLDDAELPAQVYHEAAGRDLAEAAELIAIVERSARRAAATVLERAVGDLAGHEIVGVGLGLDRGRLPDDLAKILSNHTSLHVGEGELYREALADAAASQGLKTTRHDFKSLAEIAAPRLGTDIAAHLAAIRARIGPPWARDHKDAALAAWLTLAAV